MADSNTYVAFSPAASVTVNATSTSVATAIPLGTYDNFSTLRVVHTGTALAFIRFGFDSSITADANGIALLPGVLEVFDVPNSIKYFAVYAPTGTQGVNVTSGVGA